MKKALIGVIAALCIAATLALAGCAAGPAEKAFDGTDYTWGKVSLTVPDGLTAQEGSMQDPKDENAVTLQGAEALQYFEITTTTENLAASGVELTKEINEASDCEIEVNGTKWIGCSYEADGIPVFQVYSTVNGVVFNVSSCSYAIDSDETTTVLGTIAPVK